MRICLFALDLTYKGGISKLSVELTKHLAQSRRVDEILVICDYIGREAYASLEHVKIGIRRLERLKKSDLMRVFHRNVKVAALSDELAKFDVFHAIDNRALPLMNRHVCPLIVTIHDVMISEFLAGLKSIGLAEIKRLANMIDHYPVQWFLEFLSATKGDGIIVNSHIIAKRLERLYGDIVYGKMSIIPAGFDPDKFNPKSISKASAKSFFRLDSFSKVLLHIGGDEFGSGRKGLPYLLQALGYMKKIGQLNQLEIALVVVGRIPYKWRHLFSNFKDHVIELSYVGEDALPTLYRAADLLVMPSISEGWGIALIESLACSTPVVASQNVPSAFATRKTGAVHMEPHVENPKQLAKSIMERLEDNPIEAGEWNNIFNSLVTSYSWQNYSQSHVKVYENLLELRRPQ